MESNLSSHERLLNLCFQKPTRQMSLDQWKIFVRKREEFTKALELHQEIADTLHGISDQTLQEFIEVLSPMTDYMSPQQAGRFVSEEVEKLVRNGNGSSTTRFA